MRMVLQPFCEKRRICPLEVFGSAAKGLATAERDVDRMPSSAAPKSSVKRRCALTEETRQAIPELPFRKMRGMRNMVAHDYANVDLRVVWDVTTVHVPEVFAQSR